MIGEPIARVPRPVHCLMPLRVGRAPRLARLIDDGGGSEPARQRLRVLAARRCRLGQVGQLRRPLREPLVDGAQQILARATTEDGTLPRARGGPALAADDTALVDALALHDEWPVDLSQVAKAFRQLARAGEDAFGRAAPGRGQRQAMAVLAGQRYRLLELALVDDQRPNAVVERGLGSDELVDLEAVGEEHVRDSGLRKERAEIVEARRTYRAPSTKLLTLALATHPLLLGRSERSVGLARRAQAGADARVVERLGISQ
jgi:hypothetical protein